MTIHTSIQSRIGTRVEPTSGHTGASPRAPLPPPQPPHPHIVDRRHHLATMLAAAPLLLTSSWPASPAAASPTSPAAQNQLRPMTPDEAAAVEDAFSATMPTSKAPVMLRLAFHDAGTYDVATADGGANASIRLELDRPENFGLKRGWNVIRATADRLRDGPADASRVSTADLVALAGARAVRITGGPSIPILVGRRDAASPDPQGRLPLETLSAPEQLATFQRMGFSAAEFVALCGSHTLGSKGYGDPLVFDGIYYQILLEKPWSDTNDSMATMIGIPSDHVLPDDATCRPLIEKYARDTELWKKEFAAAYVKLSTLGWA